MAERGQMEKQYSVQFFTSFVEHLQDVCRNYLNYNQFVEVSGYVCVEIDNMKKERYVLSELLQSSGNVVSESYCTKACLTHRRSKTPSQMNIRPQPLLARTDFERNRINRHQTAQRTVPSPNISDSHYHRKSMVMSSRSHGCNSKEDFRMSPNQHTAVPSYKQNTRQTSSWSESTNQQCTFENLHERNRRGDRSPWRSPTGSGSDNSMDVVPQTMRVKSEGSEVNVIMPLCVPDGSSESSAQSSRTDQDVLYEQTDPETPLTISSCYSLKAVNEPETQAMASVSGVLVEDVIDLDMIEDEEDECQPVESAAVHEETSQDVTLPGFANVYQVPKFPYDLSQRGSSEMSPGSKHVMKSAIKQFQRYHFEKSGHDVDLFSTSPEQLNDLLLDFYQCGRTLNGKELTPGSLKNVQIYLDKYLREGGYLYSISKDDHFKSSRDFIKAKVTGNKHVVTQRHIPVDEQDMEILFQNSQLGPANPDSLINTMWILNTKLFAIKGPSEHYNLKWGDIILSTDPTGREYLERPGKTIEAYSLKVFAKPESPERCFVNFYKAYRAVRPKLMMDEDSSFYLKAKKVPLQDAWYLPESLSWSSLTNLWKRMVLGGGLPINKKIF